MKTTKLHIKRKKKTPDHIFVVYCNTSSMNIKQANEYISHLRKLLNDVENKYNIYHYLCPYTDISEYPMVTIKQIDPIENKEILEKIKSIIPT